MGLTLRDLLDGKQTMKICCKAFKELIEQIDDYPSLICQLNITADDKITFDLAFYQESEFGKSWHYLEYCPFCGAKLEE